MKVARVAVCVMALGFAFSTAPAFANCVKKGAVATAESEKSAKWYALETMVQSVSWSLWPGFVANGEVAGYRIKSEKYRCQKEGAGTTCRGSAIFCKK
ncbi:MAG: hypothetical protein K0U74_13460 [Alphaproteobacteria bacterium]|nr:hypothetical protein [Alphaproteobacteria bacterium]